MSAVESQTGDAVEEEAEATALATAGAAGDAAVSAGCYAGAATHAGVATVDAVKRTRPPAPPTMPERPALSDLWQRSFRGRMQAIPPVEQPDAKAPELERPDPVAGYRGAYAETQSEKEAAKASTEPHQQLVVDTGLEGQNTAYAPVLIAWEDAPPSVHITQLSPTAAPHGRPTSSSALPHT